MGSRVLPHVAHGVSLRASLLSTSCSHRAQRSMSSCLIAREHNNVKCCCVTSPACVGERPRQSCLDARSCRTTMAHSDEAARPQHRSKAAGRCVAFTVKTGGTCSSISIKLSSQQLKCRAHGAHARACSHDRGSAVVQGASFLQLSARKRRCSRPTRVV